MLFAGCTGCLAGALAARWAPGSPGAHGENVMAACRTALRVAGGLSIMVAALLFFVIAPIVAIDTSPEATPGPAARGLMVIAAFHLLLAGFSFWKTRSVAMPVASGVFGLVFGMFLLFMASVFSHHGQSIHSAVIALLCAQQATSWPVARLLLWRLWGAGSRLQSDSSDRSSRPPAMAGRRNRRGVNIMKKVLRFIAVAGLIALASGCSIKRVAVNKLGSPPLNGRNIRGGLLY